LYDSFENSQPRVCSRKHREWVINVCELKYSSTEYTFSKKNDEAMRNKVSDIQIATGTRYALHPTLVTTYGLKRTQYWGTVQ